MSLFNEEDTDELLANSVLEDYICEKFRTKIVKEFFSHPRVKPLVIFCVQPNGDVMRDVHRASGKSHDSFESVEINEIRELVRGYNSLLNTTKENIELSYVSKGGNDYDEIICLTELLAKNTEKHIILYCGIGETVLGQAIDQQLLAYKHIEDCFGDWSLRTHMFVADDDKNSFAKYQEVYQACIHRGYVDRILDRIKYTATTKDEKRLEELGYEVALLMLMAERKLDSFSESTTEFDDRVCHNIKNNLLTGEERELLEKKFGYKDVVLEMEYEVSKDNGEILSYKPS